MIYYTVAPTVVIDGYSNNLALTSTATLPLGTTLVLVCRVIGIPQGLESNYQWRCPNRECQECQNYGTTINNNILTKNITSLMDQGKYTCIVTNDMEETNKTYEEFHLNIEGASLYVD